ncbi:MAG: biotin/lipoyl-binding protein [Rhodoferax sp.]|nr:biotin/lipoyl-binding protein [Rhodoferax sp.]
MHSIESPLQSRLVSWQVRAGDHVRAGDLLVILEAMKMEHELRAPTAGRVAALLCELGEMVESGQELLRIDDLPLTSGTAGAPADAPTPTPASPVAPRSDAGAPSDGRAGTARADLQQLQQRLALTLDASRPAAMDKRHALGLRSARENIADLCDAGSFREYGALAVAAQATRRDADDLMRNTPADGMVTGIGLINGELFGAERASAVVMAYDATVLAGTQGMRNHQKTDRLLGVALQNRLPVVLFAEGGGGRPGDVDMPIVAGLHVPTFASFARLNGRVPVLGIVAGRCFAGNAALLGCCDVVIATQGSNIGMGGPAMVEGGGLGVFRPEQIGPSEVQHANGVIDVLVDDDAMAVRVARQYLSFFQGRLSDWRAPDPLALRDVVPENRLRVYDSRAAWDALVDIGSLLPLRAGFGLGIHVALGRIEGRAVGLIANNPQHLGGAIDADAADKAARFMQLCNAHGLPIVSLIDTPGFMVGPQAEEAAQVRHVSRMFIAAAHLRVPMVSVVLRKAYGLGAMAMAGGSMHAPLATVAWPSGEFGGMGLEGAVRLGYRKELEAVPEGDAREALFRRLVEVQYEKGHALNMAATLEIDAVIDPAQTREWIVQALQAGATRPREDSVPAIDSW